MRIGDRVFVHGYIDEIRKDTVIIRNNGGYFGTIPSEVITGELPSVEKTQLSEEGTTFDIPSAEPEVIRCRDCKHHDGIRCFRWNSTIITGFDDFCSNAEKRGEENE